jgi:hypothetical protein
VPPRRFPPPWSVEETARRSRRGSAHSRQHRQAAGVAAQSREDTRNYQRPSLARRGAFGGEGLSAKLTGGGETRWTSASNHSWATFSRSRAKPDAVREGVRVALAKCEAIFRVREPNNRRALEARAERYRPAGALSCPSAALRLLEIDKGAVHASPAMATAPIVWV